MGSQPAEAIGAACFFIRAGDDDEIALERATCAAEEYQRHQLGRYHVLHVGRAATPDAAFGYRAGEGRIAPFSFVLHGHDIGVTHVEQPRRALAARQAGDQVAAVLGRAEHLGCDPFGCQPGLHVAAERQFVAGGHHAGVDRLEANQVGQQRDALIPGLVGHAEKLV